MISDIYYHIATPSLPQEHQPASAMIKTYLGARFKDPLPEIEFEETD